MANGLGSFSIGMDPRQFLRGRGSIVGNRFVPMAPTPQPMAPQPMAPPMIPEPPSAFPSEQLNMQPSMPPMQEPPPMAPPPMAPPVMDQPPMAPPVMPFFRSMDNTMNRPRLGLEGILGGFDRFRPPQPPRFGLPEGFRPSRRPFPPSFGENPMRNFREMRGIGLGNPFFGPRRQG